MDPLIEERRLENAPTPVGERRSPGDYSNDVDKTTPSTKSWQGSGIAGRAIVQAPTHRKNEPPHKNGKRSSPHTRAKAQNLASLTQTENRKLQINKIQLPLAL